MSSPCGTYGGVQAHWRRNEKLCADCREAFRDYQREYRRKRRMNPDIKARENELQAARDRARRRVVHAHLDEYKEYCAEEIARIEK